MRRLTGWFVPLFGLVLAVAVGCGDGRETHFDEGTIVATHTEKVRTWLEGVAQTGQLDSGAAIMRDEIAAMEEEGHTNTDALLADFEQLEQSRNPAAVRAKASEMLEKIPEQATPPGDAE